MRLRNALQVLWSRIRGFRIFDTAGLENGQVRSLNFMVASAMCGQVMLFITTGAPWTGYLREVLRADDVALGLIAAIPVAANTIQLLAAYLLQRYQKRRLFVVAFGAIGRFFWIPIALIPYLVPEAFTDARILLVTCFVIMTAVGNSFLNIGFASLLSDLVPMRIRGSYFSARHGISLLAGVLGALLASWLVDTLGSAGYSIVLVIAGVFGVTDMLLYLFVDFPPMKVAPEERQGGFFSMIGCVLRDKRFMMVVLCFTGWAFAVNLSSPFFNVHMLENLGMTYTRITLFNQIAQNVITVFFVRYWGRPLDQFGTKTAVQIAGRICMLTPIIWLFVTPGAQWLILIISLLNGIFWPGIDLGQQNAYLEAAPERYRAMYIAVFFAIFNLLGVALGNALGGVLLKNVFTPLAAQGFSVLGNVWTKYHYIILLSALLRIVVVLGFFPRLKVEGGVPLRAALGELTDEQRGKWQRFTIGLQRASIRRKYRAKMKKKEEAKAQEEQNGENHPDA